MAGLRQGPDYRRAHRYIRHSTICDSVCCPCLLLLCTLPPPQCGASFSQCCVLTAASFLRRAGFDGLGTAERADPQASAGVCAYCGDAFQSLKACAEIEQEGADPRRHRAHRASARYSRCDPPPARHAANAAASAFASAPARVASAPASAPFFRLPPSQHCC